ncbi:MAG: hypothetical protein OXH41_01605 [Chloroflexi bacterium]|nr:hypothetical protein [Chloroflexota bacterium]
MRTVALFLKFFGGKLILASGAVALVVLIAVAVYDESEQEPSWSPAPARTAEPAPRRITFTAFERECMQWGDSFIGTDWYNLLRDNPDQYGRFQRTALPPCRTMRQQAQQFCRVARSGGHDPSEYARQMDASLEVIGAVQVWCD